MHKIDDDDFNSEVGTKSRVEVFPDIDVRMSSTSSTVTDVMFESVTPMCCGSKVIGFGAEPFSSIDKRDLMFFTLFIENAAMRSRKDWHSSFELVSVAGYVFSRSLTSDQTLRQFPAALVIRWQRYLYRD